LFEKSENLNKWDQRYNELVTYITHFGHSFVPENFPQNPPLGHWARNQRRSYKRLREGVSPPGITEIRIKLLNKVGFEWEYLAESIKQKCQWNQRYKELLIYVEDFGDAQVPARFPQNPQLGLWVRSQRQNYIKFQKGELSSMTGSRIQLLNKVGFRWACTKLQEESWEGSYEKLLSFVKEFGHGRVPNEFPSYPPFGNWVRNQRQNYIKFQKGDLSCMTESRVKLLNKVGFEWEWSEREKIIGGPVKLRERVWSC